MCWQGLFSQSCKLQFCTLFTTCAKPPGSIFANSCRVRSKRPSIKELSHTKFRTCQEVHQGAHIGELEVFVSAKWMMHNRWYYLRKIGAIVRKIELKADLNATIWKLWTNVYSKDLYKDIFHFTFGANYKSRIQRCFFKDGFWDVYSNCFCGQISCHNSHIWTPFLQCEFWDGNSNCFFEWISCHNSHIWKTFLLCELSDVSLNRL